MATMTEAPKITFPEPGDAVVIGGRTGIIVGRDFNTFTRAWSYVVQWGDNFSTSLIPMQPIES